MIRINRCADKDMGTVKNVKINKSLKEKKLELLHASNLSELIQTLQTHDH